MDFRLFQPVIRTVLPLPRVRQYPLNNNIAVERLRVRTNQIRRVRLCASDFDGSLILAVGIEFRP
jgi:hypothetical protein